MKAESVIDEFVTVASVDEIPSGSAKSVAIGEYEIAVFHVGNEWYAIEGSCPHQGGPLAEGWVHEKTVTCPWHAWCFNLEDGKMTLGDYATVDVFDVKVEGDEVLLSPTPRA